MTHSVGDDFVDEDDGGSTKMIFVVQLYNSSSIRSLGGHEKSENEGAAFFDHHFFWKTLQVPPFWTQSV